MKKSRLSHGVPCIEFAVGNKLKNVIGSEKPAVVNPGIDI